MGQINFFKIFSILAFIAFAAISCWATAESLHLLLSSWPLIFCWVVSVGFFVIASLGTKLIVDSLNQNVYIEKRRALLIGGVLMTMIFWLLCIMPTNTHTFFFRNAVAEKVGMDIATTENYLNQIKSDQVPKQKIEDSTIILRTKVEAKLGELNAEISNNANPGYGPRARRIFKEFAVIFKVDTIAPLSYKDTSRLGREKLNAAYRSKFYILLGSRLKILEKELSPTNNDHVTQAGNAYKNLEQVKRYINNGQINLNDAEDIKTVCDKLNAGYAVIKAFFPQFVDFKNNVVDKEIYTAPNPVTKAKRLTSVFDVWEDFLNGEYAGHGFLFWIIISMLVDISAFIFFDIAFKKQE